MLEYAAFIITCIKPFLAIAIPFQILPLLILMERRGAAFIQDRPGPQRAALNLTFGSIAGIFSLAPQGGIRLRAFGNLFTVADGIKGLFKQAFVPRFADRWYYALAPAIPVGAAIMTTAVLPWFGPMIFKTANGVQTVTGQALDADAGLLVLFALGSLGVYGVVLGSWASNSKFSLLGGMRASAMMISYEVSMGLSALGLILLTGTFDLTGIVEWQANHTWGLFAQPLGFALFTVAMFAECNRTPFDVVEGESELVAGFHTEYGSGRFLAFMTGEYLHVVLASALIATLFLGGYSLLPFPLPSGELVQGNLNWVALDTNWIRTHLGLIGGIVLAVTGLLCLAFAWLVKRRRSYYLTIVSTDRAARAREYSLFITLFTLAGLGALAGAVVAWILGDPTPLMGVYADGAPVYPLWVSLVAAAIQIGVVVGKIIAVCWLFVWVRWTLPRFRYDQIMALGWKVMLNLAILNLIITAVVMKVFAHG
jgi:NADH-quinone oxidoreductase subunit H